MLLLGETVDSIAPTLLEVTFDIRLSVAVVCLIVFIVFVDCPVERTATK